MFIPFQLGVSLDANYLLIPTSSSSYNPSNLKISCPSSPFSAVLFIFSGQILLTQSATSCIYKI